MRRPNSLDTILTYENTELQSDWSVVWSTNHIPGMDNATGRGAGGRSGTGRRRLRLGALVLGCCTAIHCRIAAAALTGGIFVFTFFLVFAVAMMGNPLRHFEVYLGQWSMSGPGRAFRIIPMLDGIGIAICLNTIIRAICSCCIASITALYVVYSVSDDQLPFTYCRDFNLNTYKPILIEKQSLPLTWNILQARKMGLNRNLYYARKTRTSTTKNYISTIDIGDLDWKRMRNSYSNTSDDNITRQPRLKNVNTIEVCNEKFTGRYPSIYRTPAYNFFYIELMQWRPNRDAWEINHRQMAVLLVIWIVIWLTMVGERLSHRKLIWNNISWWILIVPWSWLVVLMGISGYHLYTNPHGVGENIFSVGVKEIVSGIADAMEVALYIHSASIGTELIHGKGLNHYALGHIDPLLNRENVIHSVVITILALLHSAAAVICTVTIHEVKDMYESTLWIIPMYSQCAVVDGYSHVLSILIFGGLTCSYITVAYILLKTALHTIFEYRVKLVFVEQTVVAALIITCMLISIIFTTKFGLPLLESVEAIMTGICMPFMCLMEMLGLLFVYRSHDFMSDVMVAMEDNTCSARIGTQWQILPFFIIVCLLCKIIGLVESEMGELCMLAAVLPLAGVLLSLPLRACHNAYVFLRPTPRRGT